MKSYIIRSSDRKRVAEFAKKQTEQMQQTYIKLVLKLYAFELNQIYGFGRERIARIILAISKDLKEIGEDYGLDCVMVKLNNELRKIGIVDENGEWNFEEESYD